MQITKRCVKINGRGILIEKRFQTLHRERRLIVKRKFKFLMLLSIMVLTFFSTTSMVSAAKVNIEDNIPVYASVEEWEASGDESPIVRVKNPYLRYEGGYMEYRYVRTAYSNDTRVGYHPDFDSWRYADGYWFSSSRKTTFTPNVSVSWGDIVSVSVGVDISSPGGSGYFRQADGSRRSRPWVRADITTRIYDSYLYDEFGRVSHIYRENKKISSASDVQIFIEHRY